MPTISKLSAILTLEGAQFKKGMQGAQQDLRDFDETQKSVSKRIKDFASGGEQAQAIKSVGKLLKGGGAVLGFRLLADDADKFAAKMREVSSAGYAADKNWADMVRDIPAAIPILGQAWRAGLGIGDAIRDTGAATAKWLGFSDGVVNSLKSNTALMAEAKESAERIAFAFQVTQKALHQISQAKLKGPELALDKLKEEHEDAVQKIRDSFVNTKNGPNMDSVFRTAMEGEQARYESAKRALRKQTTEAAEDFILAQERGAADTTADVHARQLQEEATFLAARGEHAKAAGTMAQAERETVTREYQKMAEQIRDATTKMIDRDPTHAFDFLRAESDALMAAKAKLNAQLGEINTKEVAEKLFAPFRGATANAIIDQAKKMFDVFDEGMGQIGKAERELDRDAKRLTESVRTPTEQFQAELEKISEVQGRISEETKRRLILKAGRDAFGEHKEAPAAVEVGSSAAADLIANSQGRGQDQLLRVGQQQLDKLNAIANNTGKGAAGVMVVSMQ